MCVLIQTAPKSSWPGHSHRPAVIAGPDAGGESVLDAVRPPDRLGLRAEPLHGDDRAEDLVLDHLVVLAQAGHDSRRVEVAALPQPLPAGRDLCVIGRPVHEASHPRELSWVVQRAVVGVGLVRARGLQRGRPAR